MRNVPVAIVAQCLQVEMATTTIDTGVYLGIGSGSDLELAEAIETGLPTATLALLREKGLTFTEVADLVVPPRTLQHRKARGNHVLTKDEADRLVRVARILAQANETFGDHVKALGWLRTPDERLNQRTALSMLQTEPGGRVVEEMLWQVSEGMFS